MGANSPRSQKGVVAAERRWRALELRRQGSTLAQIGAELGISPQAAAKALDRALAELRPEPPRALLDLEQQRLDHYLSRLAPAIERGDAEAIHAALRIAERRAKLVGLDAPDERRLSLALEGQADQVLEILRRVLDDASYDQVVAALADAGSE